MNMLECGKRKIFRLIYGFLTVSLPKITKHRNYAKNKENENRCDSTMTIHAIFHRLFRKDITAVWFFKNRKGEVATNMRRSTRNRMRIFRDSSHEKKIRNVPTSLHGTSGQGLKAHEGMQSHAKLCPNSHYLHVTGRRSTSGAVVADIRLGSRF